MIGVRDPEQNIGVRKTHNHIFCDAILATKNCIVLPRQARDKHWEATYSKREMRFSQAPQQGDMLSPRVLCDLRGRQRHPICEQPLRRKFRVPSGETPQPTFLTFLCM